MKKNLSLAVIALLIITVLGLGINYLLSLHKATFFLDDEVSAVSIYSSDDKEIKHLTGNGSVLLKNSKYYLVPEGDSVAKDKVFFTIEGENKEITVQPAYSTDYLEAKLRDEIASINNTLKETYPSFVDGYTLKRPTLYGRGEWFGGLLAPKVSDSRDQRDYYRVVMSKRNDDWQVIRRPEYILSASRYNEVPHSILSDINRLVP